MYIIAFYWTITTITTVGYGDIAGTTTLEMIFCSFIMIIGVISYSYATGTLASIMQNYDNHNASYQEKINILNKAQKEYNIPSDLYIHLKKSLSFDAQKDIDDLNRFVQ